MNKSTTILATGAVLLLVLSRSRKKSKKKGLEELEELEEPAANDASRAGLRVQDGKLKVVDWNEWMKTGPRLIQLSLKEGTESPEEVTANVMRRLFPEHQWPPQEDDAFFSTWNAMVVVVGKSLDAPVRPHLEVVS